MPAPFTLRLLRSSLAQLPLPATLLLTLVACDDEGGTSAQMGTADAEADVAITADAAADAADGPDAVADAAPPDAAAPETLPEGPADAPGPYAVGFHTETITYANPAVGDRPLDLHWWYPTAAAEGVPVRYAGVFPRGVVLGDAEPLAGPRPVVVFSHGNGGLAEQSFFLTEFLASHGYVVVAPDHTGNTFRDSSQPIWRLFELRPQDIKGVLDHVDTLPTEHLLADRLGPERAIAGHSFGGYTSLAAAGPGFAVDELQAECDMPAPDAVEACAYLLDPATEGRYRAGFGDDRLMAAVPMTPAGANLFGGDPGLAGIGIPTLMMTAALDVTLPNEFEGDPLWNGIAAAESLRLDFVNAGHFTFSNACSLLPSMEGDGCGEGFLAEAEAHRLINAYTLAFLRRHLLGSDVDGDLLDGTRRLEDGEIEFSRVE